MEKFESVGKKIREARKNLDMTQLEQALKDLIGHSVNMDTYGVYKHVVNGQKERAAEQVNITLLNTIK